MNWEEEESTSDWEDSAWNFNSDYYKRLRESTKQMKKIYEERLERSARHPPDEDEWNKYE